MTEGDRKRLVAVLLYDDVEPLDFAGPFEVFLAASDGGQDFTVCTVAEQEGPVTALGHLSINPSYTLRNCPRPDIVIVPGGWGSRRTMHNGNVIRWLREVSEEAEMVLSVCTGALILAKAGMLDGLHATTNRFAIDELREIVPASTVILEDARYCDNGKIILSAGVSAGIDAALYAVGKLLGEHRAVEAARIMEYDWKDAVGSDG